MMYSQNLHIPKKMKLAKYVARFFRSLSAKYLQELVMATTGECSGENAQNLHRSIMLFADSAHIFTDTETNLRAVVSLPTPP